MFNWRSRTQPKQPALAVRQAGNDMSWQLLSQSPINAEGVSAVFACVDVISSAMSALKPRLMRGNEIVTNHPVNAILQRPNAHMSFSDLISWLMGQVLIRGNGLLLIEDMQLIPISWNNASITTVNAVPTYRVRANYDNAMTMHVSADRVMHLKDRSEDGYVGISRLRRAPAVVQYAQAIQTAGIALWEHGATPSGALMAKGNVSDTQRERLKADIAQNYQGAKQRGNVLLLDGGLEWRSLDTDPKNAETLETHRFATETICRLYNISPIMVQDYSRATYTNSANAGQFLTRFTLSNWITKFEEMFTNALLDDGVRLELDTSVLDKPTLTERTTFYKEMLAAGVLTPDEVRQREGL